MPVLELLEQQQTQLSQQAQALQHSEQQLQQAQQQAAQLGRDLQTMQAQQQLNQQQLVRLQAMREQHQSAEQVVQSMTTERDSATLRLLQTEQAYFQLASHIMRLSSTEPEVQLLQQRLEQMLALEQLPSRTGSAKPIFGKHRSGKPIPGKHRSGKPVMNHQNTNSCKQRHDSSAHNSDWRHTCAVPAVILACLFLTSCSGRSTIASHPKQQTPKQQPLKQQQTLKQQTPQQPAQTITMEQAQPPHTDQVSTNDAQRLSQLEQRLRDLEQRRLPSTQIHGQGAYRHGPLISVDGHRSGTMLERLHDLEHDLATAEAQLAQRLERLKQQREQLDNASNEISVLNENLALLRGARKRATTAQQVAKERERIINDLNQKLIDIELQYLQKDRLFAEFALDVLQLESLDTDALTNLQDRLRAEIAKMPQPQLSDTHSSHLGLRP